MENGLKSLYYGGVIKMKRVFLICIFFISLFTLLVAGETIIVSTLGYFAYPLNLPNGTVFVERVVTESYDRICFQPMLEICVYQLPTMSEFEFEQKALQSGLKYVRKFIPSLDDEWLMSKTTERLCHLSRNQKNIQFDGNEPLASMMWTMYVFKDETEYLFNSYLKLLLVVRYHGILPPQAEKREHLFETI